MKINNPKVTLADEARTGVKEELRSGFLDWLHQFSVIGDDGELYSLGGSILSMHLEQMDLVSITIAREAAGNCRIQSTKSENSRECSTRKCSAILQGHSKSRQGSAAYL